MAMDETLRQTFINTANRSFQLMLKANATTPYVHEEYERFRRMGFAALVLFTEGDEPFAHALEEAFHDSNEKIEYYLERWSRDALCDQFGTDSSEEFLVRRAKSEKDEDFV